MQERTRQVQPDSTRRSEHGTKAPVVRRALAGAPLLVGASDDLAEREADVIADRVVENLGVGSPVGEVTSTRIHPSAMAQRSVIRRLSTTPSALDAAMGKSKKGILGAGKSSFATIRSTLEKYEKAKAAKDAVRANSLLQSLDAACTRYLNEHKDATTKQDQDRRKLIDKLSDEVAAERATASQRFAQISYVDSMAVGVSQQASNTKNVHAPASTAHPLQAASPAIKVHAAQARDKFAGAAHSAELLGSSDGSPNLALERIQARQKLASEKGVTPAELTGIMAFTDNAGDFEYMNPAASSSPSRMQTNKEKQQKINAAQPERGWGQVEDQTLREEGSLHTAMAVSGISKLDLYKAMTFRGQSLSENGFKASIVKGKSFTIGSLASTSKEMDVATSFAGKNLTGTTAAAKVDPAKKADDVLDVAVIFAYRPGHGGRDIEALSAQVGEAEVAMLPGTTFKIASVTKVGGHGKATKAAGLPDDMAEVHKTVLAGLPKRLGAAREVYIVGMERIEKPSTAMPLKRNQPTRAAPRPPASTRGK
jgi:hypothetical protein